jgi:hypothetical protein
VLILRAGPKLDGESVILFRNLDDPRKYRSENLNFFDAIRVPGDLYHASTVSWRPTIEGIAGYGNIFILKGNADPVRSSLTGLSL